MCEPGDAVYWDEDGKPVPFSTGPIHEQEITDVFRLFVEHVARR